MNRRGFVQSVIATLGLSNLVWSQKTPPWRLKWDVLPVSLICIIANPQLLDGQRVRLHGYIDYGVGLDEAIGLYVSESDGRHSVDFNAISVRGGSPKLKPMLGKYVLITGTFHAPPDGYGSGTNGSIDHITDVELADTVEKSKGGKG